MIDSSLLNENMYSVLYEKCFFHDWYIEKIYFSLLGNKFRIVVSLDDEVFSIVMKGIFSFTYDIEFLVEEECYDILSWNRIFKFVKYRHLLDIDIKESKYSEISTKYLNKRALKILLDFDCGFTLELDCLDIIVENLNTGLIVSC